MQDLQEKAEEKKDLIGELCALIQEAGLTLTLYGKPVTEPALRSFVEESVKSRIINTMCLEPTINLNRNVAKEKELFLAAMEGRA